MSDTVRITWKELLVIGGIIISMAGSLVYGYFLLKDDQKKNCWDMYSTEQEAILNCEGVNE